MTPIVEVNAASGALKRFAESLPMRAAMDMQPGAEAADLAANQRLLREMAEGLCKVMAQAMYGLAQAGSLHEVNRFYGAEPDHLAAILMDQFDDLTGQAWKHTRGRAEEEAREGVREAAE